MVKQGYMKTIEILLVIVITTIFLLIIMPKNSSNSFDSKHYLKNLEDNQLFRAFATDNFGCFNSTDQNSAVALIRGYLPLEYDYTICFDEKANPPDVERVFVESMVFAGNYSSIDIKVIRLYYWQT